MKYLVVLRGLSGSGKSTWVRKNNLELYTLSSDEYRLRLSSPTFDIRGKLGINQEYSRFAWDNLYKDLEFRMQHGEFTVIDATHLTKKSLSLYKSLCKKYFYRMYIVDFGVSVETCIERDSSRGFRSVGEEVIKQQAEKMEEITNCMTPDEVIPFLESRFNKICFNEYRHIHVIGDIHGCATALKKYVQDYVDLESDLIIFTGDYFDRGIENYETFQYINSLDNIYLIEGNHDSYIKRYLAKEDISNTTFYRNTLKQLKCTDKDLRRFYQKLIPCAYFTFNGKDYIASHAGVPYPCISYKTPDDTFVRGIGKYEDMQIICETFANSTHITQIFGHRNNNDVPIKINEQCYNVCGFPEYGGYLKGVEITKDEIIPHYVRNNIFSKELYCVGISKFPDRFKITDIETLVGVLRHDEYVKETKYDNISSFQFTKDAFYEGHWNNITTRARGLFIDTILKKIVARSYDKFFLLDQYEYCTLDKFTPPFVVYKKYDGFLGIIGYDRQKDSLLFCSKSTIAPYGDFANLFKSKIEPRIKDKEKLKTLLRETNCSFVFECIAPKEDEHIIKYDRDRLILLDIVKNEIEFSKLGYSVYPSIVSQLFIDVEVKELLFSTLEELDLEFLKSAKGEGYVFEDMAGKMFKLKTYEYEREKARLIKEGKYF